MLVRSLATFGCAIALGACSTMGGGDASRSAASSPSSASAADGPYASTYERFPGRPTAPLAGTHLSVRGELTVFFQARKTLAPTPGSSR